MERHRYLGFLMILLVKGEFISNFKYRHSSFDNGTADAIHVILTANFQSRLDCASRCAALHECKSMLFNDNDYRCQLLSINMDGLSAVGTSLAWLYYEKIFDCSIWHQRFGHWYILDTNYRTFNDSRTFCASLSPSSYVIEVQSQVENDWIVELTHTQCDVPMEYWLNGYDTDNSGTFTWITSQVPTSYSNWYPGEPNDSAGTISEKCTSLSTGYGGVWVDISCTETRPVVCERNS